ncbi:MAG: nicotinate (nicotinamide) nucleotide adenylyltransferase [Desulfuromonas sp.]|nr:MAG: nicotinate (nicotinamide) nucleotide adenylyltransferase [Desulfuromonas sp.]
MKLGILGGTFNPIHVAHLAIAEEAKATCSLDRVLFLPAADPPHKPVADEVPFSVRMAMVEVALTGHPSFAASDLENRRRGKSYSVQTLRLLHQEYPEAELFFIIGLDSFRDLASWRDYRQLFALAHLVVVSRPDISKGNPRDLLPVAMRQQFCYDSTSRKLLHDSGKTVIFCEETDLDISSTRIRRLVAAGQSVDHLVPPGVARFIATQHLYRKPQKRIP